MKAKKKEVSGYLQSNFDFYNPSGQLQNKMKIGVKWKKTMFC